MGRAIVRESLRSPPLRQTRSRTPRAPLDAARLIHQPPHLSLAPPLRRNAASRVARAAPHLRLPPRRSPHSLSPSRPHRPHRPRWKTRATMRMTTNKTRTRKQIMFPWSHLQRVPPVRPTMQTQRPHRIRTPKQRNQLLRPDIIIIIITTIIQDRLLHPVRLVLLLLPPPLLSWVLTVNSCLLFLPPVAKLS